MYARSTFPVLLRYRQRDRSLRRRSGDRRKCHAAKVRADLPSGGRDALMAAGVEPAETGRGLQVAEKSEHLRAECEADAFQVANASTLSRMRVHMCETPNSARSNPERPRAIPRPMSRIPIDIFA